MACTSRFKTVNTSQKFQRIVQAKENEEIFTTNTKRIVLITEAFRYHNKDTFDNQHMINVTFVLTSETSSCKIQSKYTFSKLSGNFKMQ